MKPLRVFATGFVLHFKNLSASPFMVVTAAVWPLVYATLAFLMFRATHQAPSLLYAALGAAVMGIWSTTATSAGGAVQQQRNWKVLELLVAAPSPLILVLAPITVAIAGIGVYSIVTTLLWGRLLFGVPFHVLHPALFLVSIPAAVLSIGLLGLVLASTLVLYREASAFSQMLEYPVWMITGMLIPLSLLPG
jgi:ABC-2 type transport system permease protein